MSVHRVVELEAFGELDQVERRVHADAYRAALEQDVEVGTFALHLPILRHRRLRACIHEPLAHGGAEAREPRFALGPAKPDAEVGPRRDVAVRPGWTAVTGERADHAVDAPPE